MADLEITKARALNNTKVRIDFSEPAVISDGLIDPNSYTFTALSPGAIDVFPTKVDLPPGQAFPLFVEVTVSEHTDGSIYGVQLVPAAFLAQSSNPSGGPEEPYQGKGDPPVVQLVLASAVDEVQVIFSEPVLDNAAIRDVGNYNWTGGLSTLEVLQVAVNVVLLKTTEQTEGLLYELTIRGIFAIVISDAVSVTEVFDVPVVTEDGLPVTEDDGVDKSTVMETD